jgi:signal transduction histidine kinase
MSDEASMNDTEHQWVEAMIDTMREPVMSLQGDADLLAEMVRERCPDTETHERVATVQRNAHRMHVIMLDLVDMARLDSGHLTLHYQPLELNAFLDDLLTRLATMLEVARIRTEIPPDLPMVNTDPARLERIFINLLSNAMIYSPIHTPVTIHATLGADTVIVSVHDTGRSIAREDRPHIFERFYHAHGGRTAESMGLGLFIARMLVEAHGGRIGVESDVSRGSTFFSHCRLPDMHNTCLACDCHTGQELVR